ncbi:MAG: hypothetical protein ACI9EF_000786 [Pseudohongiellaceae bacterium]|jgi:hypothetical protein
MRFIRSLATIGLVASLSSQVLAGDPDGFSPIAVPNAREALSPSTSSGWFGSNDTTIDLSEGWTMDVGGQYRVRYQKETNRGAPAAPHERDSFYLGRALLHANVKSNSGWNLYTEVIDARVTSNDLPPAMGDQNTLDVRNLYMGYTEGDTSVRIGRTDLTYGAERLISPLDWANTRRTFEGVVFQQKVQGGVIDAFITKPVTVSTHGTDHDDDSNWFSGVYSTWDIGESGNEGLDVYLLSLNEKSAKFAEVGGTLRGRDIFTVGARLWSKEDALDTEVEFAKQYGQSGGANIRAYAITGRAGYTFEEFDMAPRLGLDLDYASGDSDPTDSTKGTFNQLFPLGHAYLGFADLVGRQNIIDIQPNISMTVCDDTTLKVSLHHFQLANRSDAAYNAGGGILASGATGGKNVGNELDITLVHKPDYLGPIDHILMGWASFDPGHYVETNRSSKTIQRLYFQMTSHF